MLSALPLFTPPSAADTPVYYDPAHVFMYHPHEMLAAKKEKVAFGRRFSPLRMLVVRLVGISHTSLFTIPRPMQPRRKRKISKVSWWGGVLFSLCWRKGRPEIQYAQ